MKSPPDRDGQTKKVCVLVGLVAQPAAGRRLNVETSRSVRINPTLNGSSLANEVISWLLFFVRKRFVHPEYLTGLYLKDNNS